LIPWPAGPALRRSRTAPGSTCRRPGTPTCRARSVSKFHKFHKFHLRRLGVELVELSRGWWSFRPAAAHRRCHPLPHAGRI